MTPTMTKWNEGFYRLREFLKPTKLWLLCLSQLIDALNVSGISIAIPSIQQSLNMDEALLTWVIAAYSIAFGSLMLIAGRLGDVLGFRNVFIFGLSWFTVWSIVCGAVHDENVFVVARALQGLGAAATVPNGLALITANYHGAERERAIGYFGSASSMGFTVGLIIGGVLTFKVGYEWIFFLSAIVAGAQAILAFVIIPDDRDENRRLQEEARAVTAVASNDTNSIEASFWSTFDFLGAFLVTLALFFLVFFLTEGNTLGWSAPVNIVFVILFALFAGAFMYVQYIKGDQAIMPLAVWSIPNFSAVFVILIVGTSSVIALLFWMTQFWQYVRLVDPLDTAIQFVPIGLMVFITTPVAVRILPLIGMRWVLGISALLQVVGVVLLAFMEGDTPYWNIPFASMIVTFIGFGLLYYTVLLAGMAGAPPKWRGVVSALLNVALQVGTGIVLAITTAVSSSTANTDVATATLDELTVAYHNAFWTVVAFVCLQFVVTVLFVREFPLSPDEDVAVPDVQGSAPNGKDNVEMQEVVVLASSSST